MDPAEIKRLAAGEGAAACGIARIERISPEEKSLFDRWIATGRHGDMGYLEKYPDIRRDPALLLEGARSIVVAAFNYYHKDNGSLRWARYALGRDYHEEVRERLTRMATQMGGEWRVAVDTAPLRERYWAVKAGVGFIGLNGLLIVPGAGSWVVLGEIITTLDLEPDKPMERDCGRCGRCVAACPGQALDGKGGLDARLCRSYLSIEYRGEEVPDLDGRIYGCDICQEVCPHNRCAVESDIFHPREEVTSLTRGEIIGMEQGDFSRIFSHSAIKRTKLSGLRRNALRSGTKPMECDPRPDTEQTGDTADGD